MMTETGQRKDASICYNALKDWTEKYINTDSKQALYLGRGSGGLKGIPIKLRSVGEELEPHAQCVIHGVITVGFLKRFKDRKMLKGAGKNELIVITLIEQNLF